MLCLGAKEGYTISVRAGIFPWIGVRVRAACSRIQPRVQHHAGGVFERFAMLCAGTAARRAPHLEDPQILETAAGGAQGLT